MELWLGERRTVFGSACPAAGTVYTDSNMDIGW